jgi:hypothetical protein
VVLAARAVSRGPPPAPGPPRQGPRPWNPVGSPHRAASRRAPRLRCGLEPWPSVAVFVRWLRPACSGVPSQMQHAECSMRNAEAAAAAAQPMLPHHPGQRSATSRGGWLCPYLSRVRRQARAQHDPQAWRRSGGGNAPLRRGRRGRSPPARAGAPPNRPPRAAASRAGCRGQRRPASARAGGLAVAILVQYLAPPRHMRKRVPDDDHPRLRAGA